MPYVVFTEEQKQRAQEIDLASFLLSQGEKLLRAGREYRLASNHSITIRGNRWFDHATQQGGYPVSFVRQHYNCSYADALERLVGIGLPAPLPKAEKITQKEPAPFRLPPAHTDMRRVFAHLTKVRGVGREVLAQFAHDHLIYEEGIHHNAVFVGVDEQGIPRHAHLRGTSSYGRQFRQTVENSLAQYSFHRVGSGNTLFVFEAPIDLLSFITLYPDDWQQHSYAALCGTSSQCMEQMLRQYPHICYVGLCLDNDKAGIKAAERLSEVVSEHHRSSRVLLPRYKDWNDELLGSITQCTPQCTQDHFDIALQ